VRVNINPPAVMSDKCLHVRVLQHDILKLIADFGYAQGMWPAVEMIWKSELTAIIECFGSSIAEAIGSHNLLETCDLPAPPHPVTESTTGQSFFRGDPNATTFTDGLTEDVLV
jgi:hypothetical protein